jgi:isopenicillin N synthase-like dioxygenase
MNYQTIPVIYLSPFLNGSTGDQQAVARQVGQACEKVGFFTIIGHGVPTQLIQQANKAARLFFDLPLAEKEKVAAVAGMGYLPIESENLAASLDMTQPSDFKESLNLALPVEATSWPQEPAELITVCQAYVQAMESLAATLMQVFAAGSMARTGTRRASN